MQIGMVGLGRMGSNMLRRLQRDGHVGVAYEHRPGAAKNLLEHGVRVESSVKEFVLSLNKPRVIWLMVPAATVDDVLAQITRLLESGDIIIDGGNSYYRDDIRRAAELQLSGLHYVDVGTSGGIAGLERGYCLMIGGEENVVDHLDPIFATLAPGIAAASPTPGRNMDSRNTDSRDKDSRDKDSQNTVKAGAEQGYFHCGPHGAGHFVKMVHNGIEYGVMAAYAEGLNILSHANIGKRDILINAETTPMRDPEFYQYDFDVGEIAELWRRGSVISSWLLDLTAKALLEDPQLDSFSGQVSDSGEGRWTIAAAIDEAVPTPVLSAALFQRFSSRDGGEFSNRVLSAMRKQFGGHEEKIDSNIRNNP